MISKMYYKIKYVPMNKILNQIILIHIICNHCSVLRNAISKMFLLDLQWTSTSHTSHTYLCLSREQSYITLRADYEIVDE